MKPLIIILLASFLLSITAYTQEPDRLFSLNSTFRVRYKDMSTNLSLVVNVTQQETYREWLYGDGFFFRGTLKKIYNKTKGIDTKEYPIAGFCFSKHLEFGERQSYEDAKNDMRNRILKREYFSGNWSQPEGRYIGTWKLPGFFELVESAWTENATCYPAITYSHQKKNEVWPANERTLQVLQASRKRVLINSNTTLWPSVTITSGSEVIKTDGIFVPHGKVEFTPSATDATLTASSATGAAALLNSADILLAFFTGKRLPTNIVDSEKELINYIIENKFGHNVASAIANLGLEFSSMSNVLQGDYSSLEKLDALVGFIREVLQSAGNKTLYDIFAKLAHAAGIELSPALLNEWLGRINFIKQALDLATFAWDQRRTPLTEKVTLQLCDN